MEDKIFGIYTDVAEIASQGVSQVIDWGVHIVQAPSIWHATKGEGMKISVLDTGVDLTHPDLVGNIKAYVNFTTPNVQDATDRQGHGTHCAGVIAAIDNQQGIIGIAPSAELYIAKVLGDDGSGGMDSISRGVDWAIAQGVDVISMSLGCSTDPGPSLHDGIKRARAAGIVIVAASGNESTSCGWPAAYDEVIAVGAVDQALDKASFSNFSKEVDIAAPGVNILSTYMNGGYAKLSGTSMATPIVAGVIALIQSFARRNGIKATPDMMIAMINQRSVDLGTAGHDDNFGNGLINVFKLVKNNN
jgi:subtilisin